MCCFYRHKNHNDTRAGAGMVDRLGRRLMTISSSLSMPRLASASCLMDSRLSRSSFILAMRSSLVSMLRGRVGGRETASNTSASSSPLALPKLELLGDSPVRALNASKAPPSSTVVRPLRDVAGDSMMLMEESRFSFRSIPDASAALPSSQACCRSLRS